MRVQPYLKATGCPIFMVYSCLILSTTVFQPASATSVSANKLSPTFDLAYNRAGAGRDRGANAGVNRGANAGVNRGANPAANNRNVDPTVNQYNVYGDGQYNNYPAAGVYQLPGNYCSRQCLGNVLPNWVTYCQQYCR